jgi:molybdate/tungstate transport system substrate-binding protein
MKRTSRLAVGVSVVTLVVLIGALMAPVPAVLSQSTPVPEPLSGKITVLHAGSLALPVKELTAVFTARHPGVTFETEAAGSVESARKVSELGRSADVLMSADYLVIDRVLIPEFANWNIHFARNELILAYTDQSKYASELTADNWYELLTRPGVVFGHSDPALDPAGYRTLMLWQLAEKHYRVPGLYSQLDAACPLENTRPKSVELVSLLQSGDMDYAFEYRSVAGQHGLKFLELPPEINLSDPARADWYAQAAVDLPGAEPGTTVTFRGSPIVYGLTVPKTAERPDLGLAFVKFVIGPEGQAILDRTDQPPIVPARASDPTAVPAELQALVSQSP